MKLKKLKYLSFLAVLLFSSSLALAKDPVIYTKDSPAQNKVPSSGSCVELCADNPDCNCGQDACACAEDGAGLCVAHGAAKQKTNVIFFYSKRCPHCQQALEFFNKLLTKRSDFRLKKYEVVKSVEGRKFAINYCKQRNVPFKSVPTFFIGDKYFVGYNASINDKIIAALDDAAKDLANKSEGAVYNSAPIKIPLLGKIDPGTLSLPVLATVLGFLDGFNPCAFFVLLFLLSMLVYAESRKRMLLIGLTFVFFSALIYFIFMSAWLNFFLITSNITLITTIAGIVALIIAVLNIKDFFALKKGASLSLSTEKRNSLIKKMRSLLKAESLTSMMIGTIVLAITANLYELLCTAGFPMVFTKALTLQELSNAAYYLYLVLYNVVYVIPLLVIVIIFTYTLGSKKLTKRQGESLKLLSGMMMLVLGGILVFVPHLLNNILVAISLLFTAIILTIFIIVAKYFWERRKQTS